MTKTKVINGVLWLAFILAMAASIQHLAWVFGTVERPSYEWLGWIPALAVDTGLAALAYTIQQRRRAKRGVAILWGGVVGFALVSALANFYHALAVEGFALADGWIAIAKALVLSATLPVAYIFLGEIISGDDAAEAERVARQAERERRAAEREAEKERQASEPMPLLAEPEQFPCEVCGRPFATANSRNAHMKAHQQAPIPVTGNGKAR